MDRTRIIGMFAAAVVCAASFTTTDEDAAALAQGAQVPIFEYDPSFPKPLPENWAIGPIGGPSGGSQKTSATRNPAVGSNCITVPRNTPPRRPSSSSRSSLAHSTAYGPSARGVVTDRIVRHHVVRLGPSKNASTTARGAALMSTDSSIVGGGVLADIVSDYHHIQQAARQIT